MRIQYIILLLAGLSWLPLRDGASCLQCPYVSTSDEGEDCKTWDEGKLLASIVDEQAGYTSHVTGLVYARGVIELAGEVAYKRQQFQTFSID
jgi:hypothetical protein